jgi:GNAT superfamily N-acetyltransferase
VKSQVLVRAATLDDVEGIRDIHRFCDDPWSHPGIGPVWRNHRLLRGFLIDVAMIGNRVVAHSEWNLSEEPPPHGRYLYLGMIQVHKGYQRRGVGSAMIDAGLSKARSLSCRSVRTVPEEDAVGFYAKCGFEPIAEIGTLETPVSITRLPAGWTTLGRVPRSAVPSLPLRLGWSAQACSSFLWEICNRPVKVAGERDRHPCAQLKPGEAYVQLRYVGGHSALAVAWATPDTPIGALVEACEGLAGSLGASFVTVSACGSDRDELRRLSGPGRLSVTEVWELRV